MYPVVRKQRVREILRKHLFGNVVQVCSLHRLVDISLVHQYLKSLLSLACVMYIPIMSLILIKLPLYLPLIVIVDVDYRAADRKYL